MHTDVAWTKWGKVDPYFAVLTDDRYRRSRINNNMAAFFESGEEHMNAVMEHVDARLVHQPGDRALDFGCGVGRLMLPLLGRFDQVVGVDISDAMLAEAERNTAVAGHGRVEFHQGLATLATQQQTFAFVNSYIVLQHIPAAQGLRIIRQLLDLVRSGGVVSLHVCVSRVGSAERTVKLLRRHVPGVQQAVNILKARALSEPVMEMNGYDLATVIAMMDDTGFGPALVQLEQHGKYATANLIARRDVIPADGPGRAAAHG